MSEGFTQEMVDEFIAANRGFTEVEINLNRRGSVREIRRARKRKKIAEIAESAKLLTIEDFNEAYADRPPVPNGIPWLYRRCVARDCRRATPQGSNLCLEHQRMKAKIDSLPEEEQAEIGDYCRTIKARVVDVRAAG